MTRAVPTEASRPATDDEPAWTGLSRTASGRPVPPAAMRARSGPPADRAAGWLSALMVAGLALFLRLWGLSRPQEFAFDETYYAKDAWSMLQHGYVLGYREDVDDRILDGDLTGLWTRDPTMIVHPEAGKWLIAAGEWAFGMNPFGWRVSAAVAGALMVLVICRLARRLTGSTLLGAVAGLLLSLDGLHLVLSRLALLDIFAALFLLTGAHCLVADRQWFRRRLADRAGPPGRPVTGAGPVRGLLLRPWLALGGVSFGLAVGTKWTALVPLAALGILVWLWSAGARRSFGVRAPVLRSAVVDGPAAFVQLVGVALCVYVATWTGWLVHAESYEASLSQTQYTTFGSGKRWPTATEPDAEGLGEVVQSLRSLASYHRDVYVFHAHFLDDSDHSYASKPAGWLLLNRPVSVAVENDIQPGEQGCAAPAGSDCLRQVLLLGTPVLWWGGVLALGYAAAQWLGGRDWRAGLAVVGALSGWLPWLAYDDRPIFSFYAVTVLPFTVLAVTLALGRLVGPPAPSTRRTVGVVVAGSFVALVLLNFAYFWPVWTYDLLTTSEWLGRVWFARWV